MPQSPTPSAVFWRRRLLVLAVFLALVWVALQVFGGNGGDEPTEEPTAQPEPQATSVPDGPLRVQLTSGGDACPPESVRITPSVRPDQENRAPVEIGMVVSTTSDQACTLAPADAELVAIISQGDSVVWDSTRCRASLLSDPVELSPRWGTFVKPEWTGRKSGGSCADDEDWAPAGKYRIQAGTLGGEPGETDFELAEAPEPEPSEAPAD